MNSSHNRPIIFSFAWLWPWEWGLQVILSTHIMTACPISTGPERLRHSTPSARSSHGERIYVWGASRTWQFCWGIFRWVQPISNNINLVGGLEHDIFDFPFSWEFHHPNWQTHIFQRDRYTTNQLSMGYFVGYFMGDFWDEHYIAVPLGPPGSFPHLKNVWFRDLPSGKLT